jgi:Domain of unknown function (DUF4189)
MTRVMGTAARTFAAAFILIAALGAAHAAGALAVGACGAYGYGYDFRKIADARVAAMRECTGNACKIVGTIRRGCAAMAVDAKHPCGSFGWAIDPHLGRAENLSLRRCYEFGGKDCVVRAFACDEKG